MRLPETYRDKKICIIGLGYVGLTLAVALADVGFRVHGIEIDQKILRSLKRRKPHFTERGLEVRLANHLSQGTLTFSEDIVADEQTSVYIVTVGTPIGKDKRAHFDAIANVCGLISNVFKDGDLVVLRSTVKVGTTREIVTPILERSGIGFDLAFCPERTLEGKALVELHALPQIVGGMDENATFRASQLFSFITPSVVRVRDPETAEMAKLINNTQRDFIFAFSNEVAAMCKSIGISALEVITAGNVGYPRANLPVPGPVGGPCLEKDPYILAEGTERFGYVPQLALAARQWNEHLPTRSVSRISRVWREKVEGSDVPEKISILGLAFKGRPETDDLRGSLALPVAENLREAFPGAVLTGWDPVVTSQAIREIGLIPMESVGEAFENASIVVIQNNHECFAQLPYDTLLLSMRRPGLLYDFWNSYGQNLADPPEGIFCFGLGEKLLAWNAADSKKFPNSRPALRPQAASA